MALLPTDEQQALAGAVRRMVGTVGGAKAARHLLIADEEYGIPADSDAVWRIMNEQLSLAGLVIPEEHGGQGGGLGEVLVALHELGASVVGSPVIGSIVASAALVGLGDDAACSDVLPHIASGDTVVAYVPGELVHDLQIYGPAAISLTCRSVPYVARADLYVIEVDDGLALVRRLDRGVTTSRLPGISPNFPAGHLQLAGAPARIIQGDTARSRLMASMALDVSLAALQCGGMYHCVQASAEYANDRVAFGQPIGAFQGVKHQIADMLTAYELALSVLRAAADDDNPDDNDRALSAASARLLAGEGFVDASRRMVHIFGGIGFTWEHDAHLYYRDALALATLMGGSDSPIRRIDELAIAPRA